jgi:hypothetical protein
MPAINKAALSDKKVQTKTPWSGFHGVDGERSHLNHTVESVHSASIAHRDTRLAAAAFMAAQVAAAL